MEGVTVREENLLSLNCRVYFLAWYTFFTFFMLFRKSIFKDEDCLERKTLFNQEFLHSRDEGGVHPLNGELSGFPGCFVSS